MDNYEYIIASLPLLTQDMREGGSLDSAALTGWIKSQCSRKDVALIDLLVEGMEGDSLDEGFYSKALSSRDPFIRDYFSYDLTLRNAKVRYLNKALGRPSDQDTLPEEEPDPVVLSEMERALDTGDILGRERALDDLMWNRITTLVTFNYFDIDAILGFLARMHIIDRWLSLNPGIGAEMFQNLVDEVRGTFKGVEFKPDNK